MLHRAPAGFSITYSGRLNAKLVVIVAKIQRIYVLREVCHLTIFKSILVKIITCYIGGSMGSKCNVMNLL
jgi:hypothetical protein